MEISDRFLANIAHKPTDEALNNLDGDIAWGMSYTLDALIDLYEASGDEQYLQRFVADADRVFAARADRTGEKDFKGRITKGWLTNHHYTTGGPETLLDAEGEPALSVETIAHDSNNKTTLEIAAGNAPDRFTLRVRNTKNAEQPYERTYENLTLEQAEAQINPGPYDRGYLRVKRLGDRVPAPRAAFTPPTQKTTLHGHHTGRILNGIARFCALILKQGGPEQYRPQAQEYLRLAEESMAEHDQYFIETGDQGYTIFEKGAPIWADGIPEPHNTLAASGSVYVYLYLATGKAIYRERAERLARLIKAHHALQPDGTYLFHYWWGIVETGWAPEDGISDHTPGWKGELNVENISHFQLSLLFMVDCYRAGIVFDAADLRPWVKSFHQRIHKPGQPAGELSFYIDGDQGGQPALTANDFISGFIKLGAELDPSIATACEKIMRTHYAEGASPSRLGSWSALALAERRSQSRNQTGEE